MKTALFVDFDNVFSGLRRLDLAYAERFAMSPALWMKWLTDKLPLPPYVNGEARRRILVRRCYLNPSVYQRYRFTFSQSGFEIVDCPPMTAAGKTSTDIHMVLDMVDVLQHSTHYDEFIVFSADADFSPVLRKLRRSDRRTTVLAAGATSSAYEASTDLMIDPDDFINEALGFGDQNAENEEHLTADDSVREGQMQQAARSVRQTVDSAETRVPLAKLAQVLATQMPSLKESNWAGAESFIHYLQQLDLAPLIIDKVNATILDPRRLRGGKDPAFQEQVKESSSNNVPQNGQTARDVILQEVASANRPVPCASLAQVVRGRATDVAADWNGHGTFRRFLESLELKNLQVEWLSHGGVMFDPARHTVSDDSDRAAPDEAWQGREVLWAQVSPVFSMSNLPALSPRKYGVALACLSEALEVSEFNLLETGKRVCDLTVARQEAVSRRDVNQLLRAMLFGGFDPASGATDIKSLTAAVCGVGLAACTRERMVIDDALRAAMLSWIGGEVATTGLVTLAGSR